MARGGEQGSSVLPWIAGAAALISAMLVYQGVTHGEWRGVVITEVQVIAVAVATYLGLR